jgi:hypothetical protein
VLSRGGNRPGQRGRAPVNFNVYVSGRGIYESGLIAPVLDESGNISPVDSFGVQIEAGVYGGKDWRRHSIGLDYRADYRRQPKIPFFNGTNQAASFLTQHRLSRRILLTTQHTGGTTNRAFGGFAAPFIGNANTPGVPLNELFDVRTYFLQTSARVTWQSSARTSLSGQGEVFFVKRNSAALINAQGARALGTWSHRISRVTTLIAQGGFMRFEFPRSFAESNVYLASLGIDRRLNRNWQVEITGGLLHLSSKGVERVALSPVVAEILGRPTGLVAFDRSDIAPLIEVTVSYIQERGRLTVNASNSVMPGNGAFLTSTRTTAGAGYSYTGIRRASLGVSASYTNMRSALLNLPTFYSWQGGGGMTYKLAQYVNLMMQADRRYFKSSVFRGRNGTSVSVGLAFTPSRFPLSIF